MLGKTVSFILLYTCVYVYCAICNQNSCDEVITMPLLDNMKASLKADLDVSNMNTHLKAYIEQEIQKGVESAMKGLVQKVIDDGLKTANVTVATTINHKIEERNIGAVYTQWGRSICTANDSQLIYDGYVSGSSRRTPGSAVNHLCLPKQPQWGVHDYKVNSNPSVGGAMFDIHDIHIQDTLFDKNKYSKYGLPCSVCHTKHGTSVIMIPGRKDCIGQLRKEYEGYLMAGHHTHVAATEFICVDAKPERLNKTSAWGDRPLLYPVIALCNEMIPCPPYVNGREMTCVVCSY